MQIISVDQEGPLERLYHEVLAPTFPANELISLDALKDGVQRGRTEVTAAVDDDGTPLGTAIGEWTASCRVLLLSYLAVAPTARGTGIGSRIYTEGLARWRQRHRPRLILAEVERPDRHSGNDAHGDPAARLRFYDRHAARAIDLPYFQPALGVERSRVYGMLLLVLHADPELHGPTGDGTLRADPLREYLVDYLSDVEGGVGEDPGVVALLAATQAPEGVRTLPIERFGEIPVAEPTPASAQPS